MAIYSNMSRRNASWAARFGLPLRHVDGALRLVCPNALASPSDARMHRREGLAGAITRSRASFCAVGGTILLQGKARPTRPRGHDV
jgi:hypothetical protein